MKYLTLGRSTLSVSSIVMGMWQAGKEYWVGIQDRDIQAAIATALEAGVNTFDTAEEYGSGQSEKALGEGLKGKRDKAVILTKVFSNHLKYDQVIASCHQSLANLRTDYIDLYQIHWPSGSWGSEPVPVEETMRALNFLKSEGKVRSIGVSNFSLAQLKEASQFGQIDSLQSPYSLFWRYIETELAPYCRENQITILAYSPLAQGILSGKFAPGHRFETGDNRKSNKLVEKSLFPKVLNAVDALRPIAERKGCSLSQLALAWLTSHPNTAALAGVRNANQILDNAKAGDIPMTEDEMAQLETISLPIYHFFQRDAVPWTWNP